VPRIDLPSLDALTDPQQKVYQDILAGPRKAVRGGPLMLWLRSPELADPAQRLGAFCRFQSSLPRRLSELAILVSAAFWGAGYEWNSHAPAAAEAGVALEVIEAIRIGATPEFTEEDEEAVYALALGLLRDHAVTPDIWARASRLLSELQLVDLVGALGYYTLLSMTIKAFEIEPHAGDPDPFALGLS
jgi:4-carboxymuconolactone decarboxylase